MRKASPRPSSGFLKERSNDSIRRSSTARRRSQPTMEHQGHQGIVPLQNRPNTTLPRRVRRSKAYSGIGTYSGALRSSSAGLSESMPRISSYTKFCRRSASRLFLAAQTESLTWRKDEAAATAPRRICVAHRIQIVRRFDLLREDSPTVLGSNRDQLLPHVIAEVPRPQLKTRGPITSVLSFPRHEPS